MDEYFEITRKIHQILGEYAYHALTKIEGIKATKPEATFYLLADFNIYAPDLHKVGIITSQKLSESLIIHPITLQLLEGIA